MRPHQTKIAMAFVLLIACAVLRSTVMIERTSQTRLSAEYAKLPMSFEANAGQSDASVKFLARGDGYGLFLTSNEVVLVPSKRHAVRMRLSGGNIHPQVTGDEELPGKSNYFIGNDPSKWRTNVPTYAKVRYREIYPGIDLVYYGHGRQLEYDFLIGPGADPGAIRLAFDGSEQPAIDHNGDLVLKAESGGEQVRLKKPIVYQRVKGSRQDVAAEYRLSINHEVSFKLGSYAVDELLVIDPVFSYSTYLGGNSTDEGYSIVVDSTGNAYVAGLTYSIDFPTQNPLQRFKGGSSDAFVSKFNAAGSGLVYSTYLGGNADDKGYGIAVDVIGNVYVTGLTRSPDFPTANPFQGAEGGLGDVFVSKLNASGSALVYSTYLGGNNTETGYGIAVDASGNAYVTGETLSTTFPTANPMQSASGGYEDAFVAKFNAAGSGLVYSTYLGGSGFDGGHGIALDSSGNVYLTGGTTSLNFPTKNPIQPPPASNIGEAFVSKLNPDGSALTYSTYLGGHGLDRGEGIVVDGSGAAYVTGSTASNDFPTMNSFQPIYGGGIYDAFVTKFNATGSALLYSTFLGGGDKDYGHSIALDGSGNAYVTGETWSPNFPIASPLQGANGGLSDAFVSKFNATGSALLYSTYFGGEFADGGFSIALDGSGNAYVTGQTWSDNFPIQHPFQYHHVPPDAFVSKISDYAPPTIRSISPASGAQGTGVNVTVTGTNFQSGSTAVTVSGTGITVGPVNVESSTSLTTVFAIAPSATPGARYVTVTTPGGTAGLGVIFIVNVPLFPRDK
jgi:Beta-propeller repeat/IPT/TIG domain